MEEGGIHSFGRELTVAPRDMIRYHRNGVEKVTVRESEEDGKTRKQLNTINYTP